MTLEQEIMRLVRASRPKMEGLRLALLSYQKADIEWAVANLEKKGMIRKGCVGKLYPVGAGK